MPVFCATIPRQIVVPLCGTKATADLKFAGARLSIKKDERKPVVVLISDQKLPVEKWESEFDMMMDHCK